MRQLGAMMTQQFVQPIGWTLVHFIWQGIAAAVLLWVLLRISRKASSNVRYCIGCVALLVLVTMPIVTFCVVYEPPAPIVTVEPVMMELIVQAERTVTAEPIVIEAAPVVPLQRPLKAVVAEKIEAALPVCVLGWLIGVAGLSLWYLGGWCQLQKLRRIGTKAVTQAVGEKAFELASRLGIRRGVQIVESALVQVPTVIGWLKPVILVPASALTGLEPMQLSPLIAHELAHIKRCDYLINILQTIVEILGFYHPALWWISRRIRIERENCCDDMAVALLQNKRDYAGALFSMAQIRHRQHELAVAASGGHLTDRIIRLTSNKEVKNQKQGWIPATLTVGLLLAVFSGIAFTSQTSGISNERTLKFPADESLGEVFIQIDNPEKHLHPFNPFHDLAQWEMLSKAKGTVRVSAGKRIKLVVSTEIGQHPEKLAPLMEFKPDDLFVLHLAPNGSNPKPATDQCIPYIQHLTGLKHLDIGDSVITQKGLKGLSGMKQLRIVLPKNLSNGALGTVAQMQSLESIRFRQNRVSDRAFVTLVELPNLKELCLQGDRLTDEGLSHLPQLARLEYLAIGPGQQPFSSKGYEHIAQIPNLKSLWIDTSHCTDEKLRPFRQHPTLERISLHWESNISDQGISYLCTIPNLKLLDISSAGGMTARGMEFIGQLRQLVHLTLSHTGFSDEGIAHLADLKEVTFLQVGSTSNSPLADASLKVISGLTQLETLRTGGLGFTDEGMQELSKLQNLRELSLGVAPKVTDQGLGYLAELEKLEKFAWGMGISNQLTFAGLNQFARNKRLKRLQFLGVSRGDTLLDLSGMTGLEELEIDLPRQFNKDNPHWPTFTAAFSDEDLACLQNLKELKVLQLCGNGISDRSLTYLTGLNQLQTLFLYGQSDITDAGIKHLIGLDHLGQLHIHGGHFTDAALEHLSRLKGLERLELTSDMNFSNSARAEFLERKKGFKSLQLKDSRQGQSRDDSQYRGAMYASTYQIGSDSNNTQPTAFLLADNSVENAESALGHQLKMQEWVEDFFNHNYRDITSRKTLEWGEVTQDSAGHYSIRYKYEAVIWRKDKIVSEELFTFDKDGTFISVEKLNRKEIDQEKIKIDVHSYPVNRKVFDFPETEDFSTPEAAYAAINRVMATGDNEGWRRVSAKRSAALISKNKQADPVDPEWAKVVLNARILEVRIHKDQAVVIAEFPQNLSSKPIRSPIDYRHLTLEDGKWLNSGENRYDTIQPARDKFDQMLQRESNEKEQYTNVLDKKELFQETAEELFDKLQKGDYEKVLSDYDDRTGKWSKDGWKKLGLDYCVHTDWPSFALWVCRTFKDNPIQFVQLGEVFISDKQLINEKHNAPAVPYRLTLQDGGILKGDLYFAYRHSSNTWQPTEGIDWHLRDNPIEKVGSSGQIKQISIAAYLVSVPDDIPELTGIIPEGTQKTVMISPEILAAFLEAVRNLPEAKIITMPKVQTLDNKAAEMAVGNDDGPGYIKLNITNHVIPNAKYLRMEVEFKRSLKMDDGQVVSTEMASAATLLSGHACVIGGYQTSEGTMEVLLLQPTILTSENQSPAQSTPSLPPMDGFGGSFNSALSNQRSQFDIEVSYFSKKFTDKTLINQLNEFLEGLHVDDDACMPEEALDFENYAMATPLTEAQTLAFRKWITAMPEIFVLDCPKVMLTDGRQTRLNLTDNKEYMTGYESNEPKTENIAEGIQLNFSPELPQANSDNLLTLNLDFTRTILLDILKANDASGREIELPTHQTTSIQTKIAIPKDKCMLMTTAMKVAGDGDVSEMTFLLLKTKPADNPASRTPGPTVYNITSPKPDGNADVLTPQSKAILGTVVDSFGQPVEGALVLSLPHGGHSALTDAEGAFALEGPSQDPEVDRRIDLLLVRNPKTNEAAVAVFQPDTTPMRIQLSKALTLSGYVTDADGRPVADADVNLSVHNDWVAGFGYTQFKPTNATGYFEIPALPQDLEYSLSVNAKGYQFYEDRLGRFANPGRVELDTIVLEPEDQIAIEARFLLVTEDFFEDIGLDVTDTETAVDISGGTGDLVVGLANSEEVIAALAHKPLAERVLPALATQKQKLKTLDGFQSDFVIRATQAHRHTKTLTAPKVMVLNGEAASLRVTKDWPYIDVDGIEKYVGEGVTLDIQPNLLNDSKELLLKGYICFSEILQNNPERSDDIPRIQVANIPVHALVESGGTVLIEGPKLTISKKATEDSKIPVIGYGQFTNRSKVTNKQRMLIMIKPTIIEHKEVEAPMSAMSSTGGGGMGL